MKVNRDKIKVHLNIEVRDTIGYLLAELRYKLIFDSQIMQFPTMLCWLHISILISVCNIT